MSKNLAAHISTRRTPQSEAIPGKAQVPNSAGGYAFPVDCWTRLNRFLVLGSSGGSYYASERQLTIENAQAVTECADQDFARTLRTIVEVSDQGRAPKNDPALLALAILAARPTPQSGLALAELPKVARIGTHLFQFMEMVLQLRGWGRSLKTAFKHWYIDKDAKDLAYQVTKYAQRNGVSHRDVLRLAKPKTTDAALDGVLAYAAGKPWLDKLPSASPAADYLNAVETVKRTDNKQEVVQLIEKHNLPREVIPTNWLNSTEVWEAMLPRMPATALIRNLGKLGSLAMLKPLSAGGRQVAEKLGDGEWLRKSRVHPLAVLMALSIYRQGRGLKGSLRWFSDARIIDALDGAFYTCFANVVPTGKNHLIALDVSGSMGSPPIAGTFLSPREASAAMAMVTVRTEPNTHVTAFASGGTFRRPSMHSRGPGSMYDVGIVPVGFSPRSRLDDVVKQTSNMPFGGTDCALPMMYATAERLEVDAFVVLTDNETWHGQDMHPCQALNEYRQKIGRPAKLIVVGMVSNGFSIADPADGGMLDVVGFDANAPAVMADFVRS